MNFLRFMVTIRSGHIFQINSTMIAGMFILFTLFGVVEYSNIKDTLEDDAKIYTELKIQNNTLIEYTKKLLDELKKSHDVQYQNMISHEIKSTELELLKIQSEIQQRGKTYSKPGEIINIIDEHNYDKRVLSATIKSIITLPFFTSLGLEILASFKKSKDDHAATGSKIIMFFGIILAGILLPILYVSSI